MNASMLETYEAIVESTETIETHLQYLRKGIDEGRNDVRELRSEARADRNEIRAEIQALGERLDAKIDNGFTKLDAKIDNGLTKLDAKIDGGLTKLDAKIDGGLTKLDAKIDKNQAETSTALTKLTESVASLRGMQLALVWVVGTVVTLCGLALTLGKIFQWF